MSTTLLATEPVGAAEVWLIVRLCTKARSERGVRRMWGSRKQLSAEMDLGSCARYKPAVDCCSYTHTAAQYSKGHSQLAHTLKLAVDVFNFGAGCSNSKRRNVDMQSPSPVKRLPAPPDHQHQASPSPCSGKRASHSKRSTPSNRQASQCTHRPISSDHTRSRANIGHRGDDQRRVW